LTCRLQDTRPRKLDGWLETRDRDLASDCRIGCSLASVSSRADPNGISCSFKRIGVADRGRKGVARLVCARV
jgi:hypothetical protein